ncbi:MAG: DUF3107 domain-containing protein [Candidatus Nanopelagicales bacterium]
MEIKVGVENTPREVALESEQTPEQVTAAVEAALANGTVLSLTDDRGRTVLIPGAKIAYVEIGAPSSRRVGFGS